MTETAMLAPEINAPATLLTADEKAIRKRLRKAKLKEWTMFDSIIAKRGIASMQYAKARLQFARGKTLAGWQTLMRVHRADLSPSIDRKIERRLTAAIASGELQTVLAQFVAETNMGGRVADLMANPTKLFGPHTTVLKSAKDNEKGVLLLNYSYVYAPFAKLFDLEKIAEKYYMVLEPSWIGTCDESILAYGFLSSPVFVQSWEPRDIEFLKRLPSNLVPVRTAANWWVDHELYKPLPDIKKDADVVMVASWAEFKRHSQFFQALAQLRKQGRPLKILLAGYPSGLQKQDIENLAMLHGVRDLVEIHEWLPPEEVNILMNRAKVNVVWSRREGSNRAVIEGLFAGLPFILRARFNFGHHHEHVNPQTGQYVEESDLPRAILHMLENRSQYKPREWAMNHMTCQHATAILEDTICAEVVRRGEPWSGSLVPHMSVLHGNKYLDESLWERFADDYAFLKTTLRK